MQSQIYRKNQAQNKKNLVSCHLLIVISIKKMNELLADFQRLQNQQIPLLRFACNGMVRKFIVPTHSKSA